MSSKGIHRVSPRACRTSSLLSDGRAHGYDARSMDFRSNRAGFHTIVAATGKAVNDGQVVDLWVRETQ